MLHLELLKQLNTNEEAAETALIEIINLLIKEFPSEGSPSHWGEAGKSGCGPDSAPSRKESCVSSAVFGRGASSLAPGSWSQPYTTLGGGGAVSKNLSEPHY